MNRWTSSSLKPATSYPAIVGRILAQKRSALDLSQRAVADALDITQGAWSRIESGSSVISLDQLHAAADFLGVTPAAILRLADSAERRLKDQGVEIMLSRSESTGAAMMTGAALGALLAAILLRKG